MTVKESKRISRLPSKFLAYLLAPPVGYEKGMREEYVALTVQERIELLKAGRTDEITDCEAMMVLSQMSLEAPLSSEWAKIFTFLATVENAKLGIEVGDEIGKEEISEYLKEELEQFKKEVFRKVAKTL